MKLEADPMAYIVNARRKTVGLNNFGYFAMEAEKEDMVSNPSKAFMDHDRKESLLGRFLREHFPDEPQDYSEETATRLLGEYKVALDQLIDWPPRKDIGFHGNEKKS